MVFFQCLHIHTRFVVVAIHKTNGNDLDQVLIADIIFCQKHQMIIAVVPMRQLTVKAGTRCHIDLTA